MFKNTGKMLFAIAGVATLVFGIASCQFINGQRPDGAPATDAAASITVTNEFGKVETLTTKLSVVEGENPALPTFLTSYSATRFTIVPYICYKADGVTPIYAVISPESGDIQPGGRVQLFLLGNDKPQRCSGSLVVKLYDTNENMKQITIPMEVEIRPK